MRKRDILKEIIFWLSIAIMLFVAYIADYFADPLYNYRILQVTILISVAIILVMYTSIRIGGL